MRKFISLIDQRVATRTGHVIRFEAGVPKAIPAEAVEAVAASGCVEYSPERAAALAAVAQRAADSLAAAALEGGADSEEQEIDPVYEAIATLVAEGDASKLTKENVPKVTHVRKLLPPGIEVDSVKVYEVYMKHFGIAELTEAELAARE